MRSREEDEGWFQEDRRDMRYQAHLGHCLAPWRNGRGSRGSNGFTGVGSYIISSRVTA